MNGKLLLTKAFNRSALGKNGVNLQNRCGPHPSMALTEMETQSGSFACADRDQSNRRVQVTPVDYRNVLFAFGFSGASLE